jgi:DNA polymerase III psi subunit
MSNVVERTFRKISCQLIVPSSEISCHEAQGKSVDILQDCITFTVSSHMVYTLTMRKMLTSSSEMSVLSARTTWQYSLEARTLHILHSHHYENLESNKQFNTLQKLGRGKVMWLNMGIDLHTMSLFRRLLSSLET